MRSGVAHFNYIWGLQACGQYERAVEFAHRQLDASGWQANALNLRVLLALANIHHEMADLPPLLDIVPTWQKLARQSGVGLSVSWSQFAEGWLHYQRNELEAADEVLPPPQRRWSGVRMAGRLSMATPVLCSRPWRGGAQTKHRVISTP